MDPNLLQRFTCEDSVGILQVWLAPAAPGVCLSPMLSLLQLAVLLAGIILAKHMVARRISLARSKRQEATDGGSTNRPHATGTPRPGWIDDKPSIYTKIPRR
jgi:hypothetical protein